MDDIKYTANEDGSRSYTLTLSAEQIATDNFLGNMKSGEDLFKSWENQKSLIGQKSVPGAEATEEDWAKFYEKTRPADGNYGTGNEAFEKIASENGLNKYQAAKINEFINSLNAPNPDDSGAENLATRLNDLWHDKTPEKVATVNAVMQKSWSEDFNKEFEKYPNSLQVAVAKAIDDVLQQFGAKGVDFNVGNGGQPAPTARDRSGYEKEKQEIISSGRQFTDLDDKALRTKYNVGYIDVKGGLGL